MIATIITAGASLVAGLLLGGCASGNEETAKALLTRNAQLENQVTSGQHVATGLAVTAVILASGLAASLYQNMKRSRGGPGGKRNRKTKTT